MSFRHDVIYKLYPEVVTSVDNKSYNSSGELVNVDENAIAEKTAKLQADYDSKQYQRDRQYPNLGEQFDLLFKDINEGTLDKTGVFYTAIKSVKDAHPKPSE